MKVYNICFNYTMQSTDTLMEVYIAKLYFIYFATANKVTWIAECERSLKEFENFSKIMGAINSWASLKRHR